MINSKRVSSKKRYCQLLYYFGWLLFMLLLVVLYFYAAKGFLQTRSDLPAATRPALTVAQKFKAEVLSIELNQPGAECLVVVGLKGQEDLLRQLRVLSDAGYKRWPKWYSHTHVIMYRPRKGHRWMWDGSIL